MVVIFAGCYGAWHFARACFNAVDLLLLELMRGAARYELPP